MSSGWRRPALALGAEVNSVGSSEEGGHAVDDSSLLQETYFKALVGVLGAGYGAEWVAERVYKRPAQVLKAPADFLAQYAWVIFVSGFGEHALRSREEGLRNAFRDYDLRSMLRNSSAVMAEALRTFNNPSKVGAVIQCAERIGREGWEITRDVLLGPQHLEFIDSLPFMGRATRLHLAKSIGYDLAKPDRHLVRLSSQHGYGDSLDSAQLFVRDMAEATGERVRTIDYVLWRASEQGMEQDPYAPLLDALWDLYPEIYEEFWQPGIQGTALLASVQLKYSGLFEDLAAGIA